MQNALNRPAIKGYFQSFVYPNHPTVKQKLNNFRLERPSKYYLEIEKLIYSESTLAVHIRRGDYSRELNSIGMLSSEYFEKAFEFHKNNLKKYKNFKYIFIFSDSIQDADIITNQFRGNHSIINIDRTKLTDEESLVLMSKFDQIIISNSTFSWWGAWFNQNSTEKVVAAPSKWFINMDDPELLIPENWHKIPSHWENFWEK